MINYNLYIDAYSTSPTQNNSPSFSVLKKQHHKIKPHSINYSGFSHVQSPEDLEAPLILIHKKPLNESRRRIISINLRLPDVTPLRRIPSVSPKPLALKPMNLSMDLPKPSIFPQKQDRLPVIIPRQHLNEGSFLKTPSNLQFNSIKFRDERNPVSKYQRMPKISLYDRVNSFQTRVKNTYKRVYEEIDIAQKGFIILDDFINLVMFVDIINSKTPANFEAVKTKANEILQMFYKVSNTYNIKRIDFYAVCSIFEFVNDGNKAFNVLDDEIRALINTKSEEFFTIFKRFAKSERIKIRDLHSLLNILHLTEINLIEGMLYLEVIDFACFLRYIPLFMWIHKKTSN